MRNVPPKADVLDIWSPPDDAVWGAYRTSRGQSLEEERLSLGWAWKIITLEDITLPCFLLAPSASCVQLKCDLSVSCPYHRAPPFPTMRDSVPLEPGAKIDPFFLKFFWVMAFYHSSRIHEHLPNFTLRKSEERAPKQTCGGY